MNREHLIRAIADETGEPLGIVEQIVTAAIAEIRRRLDLGHKVKIEGFGTFSINEANPKTLPHPITGAPVEHPGYRDPRFKATHEWRRALNTNTGCRSR